VFKRIVSFDTETDLIRPACLAPSLVCVTYQILITGREGKPDFVTGASIIHQSDPRLPDLLRGWFEDPETLIVGHNVAYDTAVIAERFPELRECIFAAYDADRVTDTKLRQQLLDIAGGVFRGRLGDKGQWITHEYTLEALARRCAGMQLQKDAWRLSYAEFLDTPIEEWPTKAREVQARAAERLRALERSVAA
jgi:hypothetical protein